MRTIANEPLAKRSAFKQDNEEELKVLSLSSLTALMIPIKLKKSIKSRTEHQKPDLND